LGLKKRSDTKKEMDLTSSSFTFLWHYSRDEAEKRNPEKKM